VVYDVIVVGAGPGGTSAATFLASRGVSTLLLDKASFPREKVCGDGLTPQAVYWLDRLGCVDEVLAETNACIRDCDLYINGEHVLTGGFPKDTIYPDFAILLDRRRLDNILLENAITRGAAFEGERHVTAVESDRQGLRVVTEGRPRRTYRGRIVIGADGVSSVVSRSIGNTLKDGVTAVSLRTYFRDVESVEAPIKVYFDRTFFPGYGWLFVDDDGFANVGLGYAFDANFPLLPNLRERFDSFVESELADVLAPATQCGSVAGGSASFFRPKSLVADRVMLIGDAANQADPLNGGGIHKAMESAYFAADAAEHALATGDCSAETLRRYECGWSEQFELDWRTAELFLSIAKNPDLRDVCLVLLKQIGGLTREDVQFRDFCAGVFSGVISQSICLSPVALYRAFPRDLAAWASLLAGEYGVVGGSARLALEAVSAGASAGGRMALRPLRNLDWGMEVATKAVRLAERRVSANRAAVKGSRHESPSRSYGPARAAM
jgi:geranylgeranyl reductase family protein